MRANKLRTRTNKLRTRANQQLIYTAKIALLSHPRLYYHFYVVFTYISIRYTNYKKHQKKIKSALSMQILNLPFFALPMPAVVEKLLYPDVFLHGFLDQLAELQRLRVGLLVPVRTEILGVLAFR